MMPAWEAEARQKIRDLPKYASDADIDAALAAAYAAGVTHNISDREAYERGYDAGVKSRTSERVCAEGHAQDPLWSACFICTAYDNGMTAGHEKAWEKGGVLWSGVYNEGYAAGQQDAASAFQSNAEAEHRRGFAAGQQAERERVTVLEAALMKIEALTDDPKEPDVWHVIVDVHQEASDALAALRATGGGTT